MKSCVCTSLDSPVEASRPSFQSSNEPKKDALTLRRLVRKPSKLQTTMEITRCRIGNTSRQAAPIGYEDFAPQRDWTPIFHAVYHDREGALHHYLHAGVSPDETEGSGIPLLSIAAACGHFEIADILLKAGARIDAASKSKGETALHIAVKASRHDIIDLLIEHRANLGVKTINSGETALHYAASGSGSLALVMKLLKSGADYNVQSLEGHTPAVAALKADNLHAAVAIINMARGKPKQLVQEKDLLLQYVEKTKGYSSIDADLIADVFAATCDPDSTILVEAIKKNDARLVEMFLERGADPLRATARGMLPIFVAVKFAGLHIIKMLVQHGADVTVRGPGNLDPLQVLFKTSSTRDEDTIVSIVDYLLAKGADGLALYSDGKTLLHRTVNGRFDCAKVVKCLLKNGIEVNLQDEDGNTALHLAAHNGLGDVAKVMLGAHADTTIVDSNKRTPLVRAVMNQQWCLVRLLAIPPAMTSWDAEGSTALHHVARSIPIDDSTWENIAAAAIPFCERGVCRSMRDRSGATPLIQAIRTLPDEGLPVIQALLAEGDKKWNCVGHEDHKRRDALYYAAVLGKPLFVEVLLEHDAPFVLEEWNDSKRQYKIPAVSKHRILELLLKSNQQRRAMRSQNQHSPITETRIEIIRTEPRSGSALSGYGADCEMEGKSKPDRSTSRRAPVAGVTTQQRKPLALSVTFPTRTSSKQQRPRGFAEDHYLNVSRPLAVPNRIVIPNAAAVALPPRNEQRLEVAKLSKPRQVLGENANSLAGPSSKQQTTVLLTSITSKLHTAGTIPESPLPQFPTLPAKNPIGTHEVDTPAQVPQTLLDATEAPVQSMPPVAQATIAIEPKLVTAPRPSAQTSAILKNHAAQVTAEVVKPASLRKPSPAASNIATSEKAVQPTRVDSGASMTYDSTSKALSTVDRSKSIPAGTTPKSNRQSGDELASWLAISNMLDRL